MAALTIYQALGDHLAAQPSDMTEVTLTLDEIGAIIGRPVSVSARQPGWWANSGDKPHIRALRRAGWRVARPAGARYGPRVTFERVASTPIVTPRPDGAGAYSIPSPYAGRPPLRH